MAEETQELDFNMDNYSSFFYTSEKQIKKMDDSYVVSKITEKYPDCVNTSTENMLKQSITLFLVDSKHVLYILDYFDITIHDLFKIIYRTFPFIFNTCFINKVHDIIKNRSYAKRTRTRV